MPAVYASMRSAGDAALYVSMGEAAPVVVPNAPTGVTATPTGGTTASFSLTDTNAGTATYRWQISLVGSGTWADAVGGANPAAATTFSATGGTPATEWLVRARGETGAGDSAWVQAASSFWFDNTGTGGGVIGAADVTAPTLTGTIAITALTSSSYTATCPAASDAVGVSGYQWRLGGTGSWTDIAAGGRVATFSGRTPASTDALEMRARDASGNFSTALTTSVTLLGIAPAVTTQPASASVAAGATATFTAAFSGTPTPTRQWFRNGAAISGATGLSYSLATVLGDTGAIFTCTATNSAGTITTNAVTLTVTALAVAPSIATQPASQTIAEGGSVTFSVSTTGTTPISYQWRRNGADIPGATSSSYALTAALADSGATFSVYVSNAVGSATSAAASLVVTQAAALVSWMDWAQELLIFLPDAPLPTVMLALRREAASFFRSTRSYRSAPDLVATTTAGLAEYVVTVPAGLVLVGVPEAQVDGTDAEEIMMESGTPISVADAGATPLVGAADGNYIRIWPTPAQDDLEIRATLAFTVADDSDGLDEQLYLQHREPIKAMALDYMMSQKGKPWSDPALAMQNRRIAQRGRLLESSRTGARTPRARIRVTPN